HSGSDTYQGDLRFTLWFKDSGDVHARLGDQLKTLVNNVNFHDDELTGVLAGDIGAGCHFPAGQALGQCAGTGGGVEEAEVSSTAFPVPSAVLSLSENA